MEFTGKCLVYFLFPIAEYVKYGFTFFCIFNLSGFFMLLQFVIPLLNGSKPCDRFFFFVI